MRLAPRSLHARLLVLSALASTAALGVAGFTVASVLERFVIEGLDERLDSQLTLLASVVAADGRIDRSRLEQRLATLQAGPGWRWRIMTPTETTGSSDFPILDPGPPHHRPPDIARDDSSRLIPMEGASEAGVPVHARRLTIQTDAGPVTITAAAPRDVVLRPIRGALMPLFGVLILLAGLLTTATLVQLRVGLRPLRRLREQLTELRTGLRGTVDEDQPTELRPLAAELNALAAQNAAALAGARQSAANLAHALKTPVAALAIDVRDDPARSAQVARIDTTIRHHLARARVQVANHRMATALAPAVADLVETVGRLHLDRGVDFAIAIPDDLSVALDPHDLDELLGNLLDNAARYASRGVTIEAHRARDDARRIEVAVSDDGPGIPTAARDKVMQPGVRLDEQGDGHGFGLAIAIDLTAIYGGSLTLEDATPSGLRVVLTLPTA